MIYKLPKELSMLDIDTICSNSNFNSLTKGSGGKGQEEPVILAPAESDDHFKAKHVHPNHLQLISLQFKTVISQMMSEMPVSTTPTANSKISCSLVLQWFQEGRLWACVTINIDESEYKKPVANIKKLFGHFCRQHTDEI